MVARRAHNPKVRGSSPLPATLYSVLQVSNVRMSIGDFFLLSLLPPLSLFAISKEVFYTPREVAVLSLARCGRSSISYFSFS